MALRARAADIGYGVSKGTMSHLAGPKAADTVLYSFPSLAVQKTASFDVGDYRSEENVTITVKGVPYVVGKDVFDETDGTNPRTLSEAFCDSPQYMALLRGMFYRMGLARIDCLTVGLPLTTWTTQRESLREQILGVHEIPHPSSKDPGSRLSVEVCEVIVLPQPLGAFYNYTVPNGYYDQFRNEMNLIVDPGYGTVDWFLSMGVRPQHQRCGAYTGGVSLVLNAVADAISADLRNVPTFMNQLDLALRENKPIVKVDGKDVELAAYRPRADAKIREQLEAMSAKIRTVKDVNNIILTGGGATLFRPHLEAMFPGRTIHCADNPSFANVLGFQVVAEETLRKKAQGVRA